MKSLARGFVWWPGIDGDLEAEVKCVRKITKLSRSKVISMVVVKWIHLHIDFAGPFMRKTFFMLVDEHSKWLEVVTVLMTSTMAAIKALSKVFATHGLPEMIVSHNGTAFHQCTFMKVNGIKHATSSPYYPGIKWLSRKSGVNI